MRKMFILGFLFFFFFTSIQSQTIQQLPEISIDEELPVGAIVTFLPDKIPNLDQSIEYDLVTPLSSDFDVFSIDHQRHTLNIKRRIDFETLCLPKMSKHCIIPISIAVSNHDKIDVYLLPIEIKNLDDNPLRFSVNRTVIEIEENDEDWFRKSYPLPAATDADGDAIHYSISLRNWSQPTGLFELDEGNLRLKALRKFDREEQKLYSLRLVARNQHDKDVSTDIIVLIKDVNDHPPRCQFNSTFFSVDRVDSISRFSLNVTDPDEGDNGTLEYRFVHPTPGFFIDDKTGEIQFDASKYTPGSPTKLFVNISDHGKPTRLSTQCLLEFQLTFLYEIHFELKQTENIHAPIGAFQIRTQQSSRSCEDCTIAVNSSLKDLVILKDNSTDLYLNMNSLILVRILSNLEVEQENLPIEMSVEVHNRENSLIISRRNISFNFNLNKKKFLANSKILFLKVQEATPINQPIALPYTIHSCLKDFRLIDPTNTFELQQNASFILRKPLNVDQQSTYQLLLQEKSKEIDCSIQLYLYIINPYSLLNVYPYFSQTFDILTSANLSSTTLPSIPPYVKYHSSNIDERTRAITLASKPDDALYSDDFQIELIDSQMPSLSCSITMRVFLGKNLLPPKIRQVSREFIDAYDPELENQQGTFPPTVEYEIEDSEDVQIDRYTGRLLWKNGNRMRCNFTVKLTDFGQPTRLVTREQITLDLPSNSKEISMKFSGTFLLLSIGSFLIILLFILLLILLHLCRRKKKPLVNLSPSTPDRYLIDNEYITTTTSLPRQYPPEKLFVKHDHHSNLSIQEINKYLERFEKIYNNTSIEPVGSVV